MKVKDSYIGKKIIANKGVQTFLFVLIGIILFGAYELIRFGVLNNTLPVFLTLIILDIISMLKIAWEEYNPEKAKTFKWVWTKAFQWFKLWQNSKKGIVNT